MSTRGMSSLRRGAALSAVCVTLSATPAFADRTFLVGGTVLEGKAVRKGDKVIVQLESGSITVPADSVERIEKAQSTVSRFDALYAALPKGEAKARLDLADYCRDHGMRAEERRLLLEVLDLDRENAAARARLGYVKTDAGWITQAEAMRASGLVQHEGDWVTRADLAEEERQRLAREAAAERREADDRRLQTERMQLATQQAAQEAEAARTSSFGYGSGIYFSPIYPVYPRGYRTFYPGVPAYRTPHAVPGAATRHFEDTSLSVVKVPYRSHH
jgi:hypothetical protein